MSIVQCDHFQDGEKLQIWIEYDARGIPLGRACYLCVDKLKAKFRPEVLTDPNYECNEQIEPED